MSEKSNKAFDRLVEEKFRDFHVEPSIGLWNKISAGLDKPAKKRFPYTWPAAACLLLVGGYVFWLSKPASQVSGPALSKNEASIALSEQIGAYNEMLSQASSVLPNTITRKKEGIPSGTVQQEVQLNKSELISEESQSVAKVLESPVLEEQKSLMETVAPAPALTFTEPEVQGTEEQSVESYTSKQRGKGLGRLVNFIVAQVDGREDKLIEVSEDPGEGLHITGLNLGLIKMKNKNNK